MEIMSYSDYLFSYRGQPHTLWNFIFFEEASDPRPFCSFCENDGKIRYWRWVIQPDTSLIDFVSCDSEICKNLAIMNLL